MAEEMIIKCVFCRREFEWDDSMYRFCNECLWSLDTLGIDVVIAERILMAKQSIQHK